MTEENVVGQDAWDELAELYNEIAPTKEYNAYYDRPNMLALMPDLHGRKVLDAGCGPGIYAVEYLKLGADVTSIDLNGKMVEFTKKRVGDRAKVLKADIAQPLTFAEDEYFDIVSAPLVLDYIKDWNFTFSEFFRVMKPGGHFIFSCGHPSWYLRNQHIEFDNYFTVEFYEIMWNGFGKPVNVPSFKRPLQNMTDALFNAGFLIEKIVENRPTEEMKLVAPNEYEKLNKEPGFITFLALKPK